MPDERRTKVFAPRSGAGNRAGRARCARRLIGAARRCAAAMVLVAVGACAQQTAPTDHMTVGEDFPVLEVFDLDGAAATLAPPPGKLVVLNVWATWCAACRKELPSLERLSRQLDPRRFEVIGLSLDNDSHAVREYLIDRGVTYANFMDPSMHSADEVLGVKVYPYTFVIGPAGELVGRVVGMAEWDDARVVAALEAAYRGDGEALAAVGRP